LKNDYNLNLPRYIDSTEPEDVQDIDAHLRGGIPNRDLDALKNYWKVLPGVRATLFKKADRAGYSQLKLAIAEVRPAILGHSEFSGFNETVTKLFVKWRKAAVPHLKGLAKDGRPKALIETLAEELLATFKAAPLLDAYDVYQHVMDYWAQSMQDDCYLIAEDGWHEAAQPRLIGEERGKRTKAKPDFVLGRKKYQAELVPPRLIISRWFADQQAALEKLETDLAALQQQLDEMAEEHGGEEGLLADAVNDKGKLTKAGVTARFKEIKGDIEAADEIKALKDYLVLVEQEASATDKLGKAQDAVTEKVAACYAKLTVDEIKTLVVDDKWLGALAAAVQRELDRVSQTLTGRIRQLAERYATPMPQLTDEVTALATRVEGHLKKMGAVWK
jgi:type I restriction enzyme M protein